MKILSFAFNGDKDNLYLPERLPRNSVCYTGTHDNDTLIGYLENASPWDRNNFLSGVKNSLKDRFNGDFVKNIDDEFVIGPDKADGAAIGREHDAMISLYRSAVAAVRSVLPAPENDADVGDIMEFSPENEVIEFAPE